MKERALQTLRPPEIQEVRYKPDDRVLAFLRTL
jgi:hypothetical protein